MIKKTAVIFWAVLMTAAFTERPSIADSLQSLKAQFRPPPAVKHPGYNPYTPAKSALGRTLFFDPRLSGSNTIACAHCHNPEFAWEDGQARSVGETGEELDRHTPTILNVGWGKRFGWDGRIPALEGFVLGPITNAKEMNQDVDELVAEIKSIVGYRPLFAAAFPGEDISIDHVSLAIATFQRSVRVDTTAFDRWIDGDEAALGEAEIEGFRLFVGKAGCVQCHKGWNMTDDGFHDIGLKSGDPGRGGIDGEDPKWRHAFKTPTLRGIAKRAPFMHDGSLETLAEVVDHYNDKFLRRPTLAKEIKSLSLNDQEKLKLLAFLRILTGDTKAVSLPEMPQ